MAKNSMVWDGLSEYRAQLLAMPRSCVGEAAKIVEGAVNSAYVRIATVYGQHRDSGNLQAGLKILTINKGELRTGKILRNTAPHAWLFEHGTETTRYYTGTDKLGRTFYEASRGKMPPTPTFWPAVIAERRRATENLKAMVLRHGATSVMEVA